MARTVKLAVRRVRMWMTPDARRGRAGARWTAAQPSGSSILPGWSGPRSGLPSRLGAVAMYGVVCASVSGPSPPPCPSHPMGWPVGWVGVLYQVLGERRGPPATRRRQPRPPECGPPATGRFPIYRTARQVHRCGLSRCPAMPVRAYRSGSRANVRTAIAARRASGLGHAPTRTRSVVSVGEVLAAPEVRVRARPVDRATARV